MGRSRRLPRLAARAALALGGMAVAVAAGEVAFRAAGYGDPAFPGDHQVLFSPTDPFVIDDSGALTLRRAFECEQQWLRSVDGSLIHSTTIRTNAHGLRGGDLVARPDPTRPRILGLGDSVAFGQGVEDDQTFLAVAQEELSRRGRPVELLNAGVPKRDLAQQIRWLEEEGLRLRPSVVLQCFYVNDLLLTDLGPEALAGDGPPRPAPHPWQKRSSSWRRHSYLLNSVWTILQHRRAMAALRRVIPEASEPGWTYLGQLEREWDGERARGLFQELRGLCERGRARAAVAILPSYIPGPPDSVRTILDGAEAAAREAGLTVVRLDDVGQATPLVDQYVVPGDQHPDAAIHGELGRALAERLPGNLVEIRPVDR